MTQFVHLHCHTQFSLLDGATDIASMMKKAAADGQKAVAMTDHGNMFGCFSFVKEAKANGLKPILGCEFYMVADRHKHSFLKSGGEKDERFHQLLLAKNQTGYENLSKLCSLGFIEGLYGKFPRIDKELLLKYHEGIIATSCCVGAEIPQAIVKGDLAGAEQKLKWWLELLGEDFYIEIQRHRGCENIDESGVSQEQINQVLLKLAEKYKVKTIVTNDVHYLEEEDYISHDVLLCINTNSNVEETDRFQFPSSDFYFKTTAQMQKQFGDLPHAIEQTFEIAERCFIPNLERDVLLPNFPIPPNFKDQNEYLEHLVFEGAKRRYGSITKIIEDRLRFEISVIEKMKFAGYFLIVQDFIKAARELGVSVGPGRGSAAGSAVAYCLTITDIDPIKYNLLFERFLNPERISWPDIDIDFDDRGRQKVIDYVVQKYGRNQVAQIVTFGTMAAKSSIRDVARVKQLDLSSSDRLAKMVPTRPGVNLKAILEEKNAISDEFTSDEKKKIQDLRNILKTPGLESDVLNMAMKLEGSVRNTGVHAAGIIIAPDEIMRFIPVCTAKDTDLYVTQIEGNVIEYTGLLKMDFLGLNTLSIIDDTIFNIVKRHGEEKRIKLEDIPLDDIQTLELFQKGQTIGLFQFESEGMRSNLKNLKPSDIEDIIAMNALFRPGPMAFIDEFISRKNKKLPVEYPHPWLEEILKPTYGIMVYQEQIMQAAQIMADYSLGEADVLRRAMGKKKKEEMDKQSSLFVERASKKGIDDKKAQEIFDVMAKFAAYGFNRSHAAAYSILAFQTAYLKAHYPAEFMAAVLTANKNNVADLSTYLHECQQMKLTVLGPDINESEIEFTVNEKGHIRFGLSALKGVGEGPVTDILQERDQHRMFLDFADMIKRLNSRIFNKKVIESCVYGGAFDCFTNMHRAQYFAAIDKYPSYIECMLRWGNQYQSSIENQQASLFGESYQEDIQIPSPPICAPWNTLEKLEHEVEVAGIYLSSHPLDDYRLEIKHSSTVSIDKLEIFKEENRQGYRHRLCGIITEVQHRTNQKGEGFGIFKLQDYFGSIPIRLFKEQYLQYKGMLNNGVAVMIDGTYDKSNWKQNDEEWVFKVSNIILLSSALSHVVKKSLTVFVRLDTISDQLIEKIDSILKNNKGNMQLKIQVIDLKQEQQLALASTKKVTISSELLIKLEELGLNYKLN
ncbi:MAG: DNA polymerase III subunit alpha [Saprospiraceae bacterium]|nr:DNA polymerase III subunit alpha [Saprospiraceae bacterium]MBK9222815.1 DNA polymerase III subunit alpha [Saprospiraceae bacterium]MBK9720145.1 DNA polymerase III subunit alpha [Saprospiraceae bacterium]